MYAYVWRSRLFWMCCIASVTIPTAVYISGPFSEQQAGLPATSSPPLRPPVRCLGLVPLCKPFLSIILSPPWNVHQTTLTVFISLLSPFVLFAIYSKCGEIIRRIFKLLWFDIFLSVLKHWCDVKSKEKRNVKKGEWILYETLD